MAIGWHFPPNNHARDDGFNDPGIETFRNDPLASLAREICQNSCDADAGSGKPVEVHFKLESLPRTRFPEVSVLCDVMQRCAKYTEDIKNAKTFFRKAKKLLQQPTVRMLRISDFNTSGLNGNPRERHSDFYKLTKAVGVSVKRDGATGSFGIGKHAPFACSDLRTVFYSTLNADGHRGFQGVAKLVTHEDIEDSEPTQGTGFYGETSRNEPIVKASAIPEIFRRTREGTDVVVMGFIEEDDWEDEIAKSIVESFLVAIHDGRFVATVGQILINKESLSKLVARYAADNAKWRTVAYHAALTSEERRSWALDDIEGLGGVELHLLQGADFPKKVAMVRTGMRIQEKGFHTPTRFAGVLNVRSGTELNEVLRSMEPPAHDSWEANRSPDKTLGRNVLKQINDWVRSCVRELTPHADLDAQDAEGMSEFLPDDEDVSTESDATATGEGKRRGATKDGEGLEPAEAPVSVFTRVYGQKQLTSDGREQPVHYDDGDEPVRDGPNDEPSPDPVDKPTQSGTGVTSGLLGGDGSGGHADPGVLPTSRPVRLRSVRAFCTDPASGRYRVLCEPETSERGYLKFAVVGEVGQDAMPIASARIEGKPTPVAADGSVGPIDLSANERLMIEVSLVTPMRCSLGVTAHAN